MSIMDASFTHESKEMREIKELGNYAYNLSQEVAELSSDFLMLHEDEINKNNSSRNPIHLSAMKYCIFRIIEIRKELRAYKRKILCYPTNNDNTLKEAVNYWKQVAENGIEISYIASKDVEKYYGKEFSDKNIIAYYTPTKSQNKNRYEIAKTIALGVWLIIIFFGFISFFL